MEGRLLATRPRPLAPTCRALTSADANPDSYPNWTAGPSSTSGWPMEASQIRPSAFHPPRRDSLKRASVSAPKADGAEPKAEAETTGWWSISRRRPFCEASALILSYADPAEWLSPLPSGCSTPTTPTTSSVNTRAPKALRSSSASRKEPASPW